MEPTLRPTLDQLPEAALLTVLKYVDWEDLLTCRIVCKRLGSLALHMDAWRHRRLFEPPLRYCKVKRMHIFTENKYCLCAVLRLAPCLDAIAYYGTKNNRALTTTKCAVEDIILELSSGTSALEAGEVVRNQEALGRLKSVTVHSDEGVTDGDLLLSTLAASSTLYSCRVSQFYLPTTNGPIVNGPSKPSLQYIDCKLSKETESFVNQLLRGHTATLEEVHVVHKGAVSDESAALLSRMPNLRNLVVDLIPGLEHLKAHASLQAVTLLVQDARPAAVQGAVRFLHGASQLISLVLAYDPDVRKPDFGTELITAVGALTYPAPLRLEKLSVIHSYPLSSQPKLIQLLPRLRALTELGVTHASLSDELLLSITPEKVPALRSLQHWKSPNSEECTHAWMHRAAVKKALGLNPSLHILVRDPTYCRHRSCKTCALRCHRDLSKGISSRRGVQELGLHAHAPNKCPCPEGHVDTRESAAAPWVCNWIQIS